MEKHLSAAVLAFSLLTVMAGFSSPVTADTSGLDLGKLQCPGVVPPQKGKVVHLDKIVFVIKDDGVAKNCRIRPSQLVDIKIEDDPNQVTDLTATVADFLEAHGNPCKGNHDCRKKLEEAIDIRQVLYATACVVTGGPPGPP